jgi:hypothetical protein
VGVAILSSRLFFRTMVPNSLGFYIYPWFSTFLEKCQMIGLIFSFFKMKFDGSLNGFQMTRTHNFLISIFFQTHGIAAQIYHAL